jgi:hypothetical protein
MDNEHRSLILTNAKNCMIASKSEMHQGIILQELMVPVPGGGSFADISAFTQGRGRHST